MLAILQSLIGQVVIQGESGYEYDDYCSNGYGVLHRTFPSRKDTRSVSLLSPVVFSSTLVARLVSALVFSLVAFLPSNRPLAITYIAVQNATIPPSEPSICKGSIIAYLI